MNTILQLIISIVVVYLIFSTVVNVIVELLSGLLRLRGEMLMKAILHFFDDGQLGKELLEHPRIKSLKAPDQKPPSYIPASSVSSALIDIIASRTRGDAPGKDAYAHFLKGVESMEPGYMKTLLGTFADRAKDVESLAAEVEKWFNDSMDRVSGWYKRKTRLIIIIAAVIVTVGGNVDTIHIIRSAQADPVLRQSLNDLGDRLVADSLFIKAGTPTRDADYYEDYINDDSITETDSVFEQVQDKEVPGQTVSVDDRLAQLQYLNDMIAESDLPIGWTGKAEINWPFKILGWLLTVFALSAGAPFWFDVLKGFINIRSSGPTATPKK